MESSWNKSAAVLAMRGIDLSLVAMVLHEIETGT
jgi:hypothetical protein